MGDIVAGAVRAELFVQTLIEAVFGGGGDCLSDHLAGEVEVGEDLR
jgi:hypothetical protein